MVRGRRRRPPRHRPRPHRRRPRHRRPAAPRQPHHLRARRSARDQHAARARRARARSPSPRPTRSRRVPASVWPVSPSSASAPMPAALRPRVIDEPRYRAMDTYFDALGAAGATMMRGTASLQVNVGYGPDVDAQWEYAHDLAPVVAAMFANSPLLDGRPERLADHPPRHVGRARPAPHAPGRDRARRAQHLDPVRARRAGDAHPRRRRLHRAGRAAHPPGLDPRRSRARTPDRGRRRLPPHHAVPADPPARLARAADARRAPRALVAHRGRGDRHRARRRRHARPARAGGRRRPRPLARRRVARRAPPRARPRSPRQVVDAVIPALAPSGYDANADRPDRGVRGRLRAPAPVPRRRPARRVAGARRPRAAAEAVPAPAR